MVGLATLEKRLEEVLPPVSLYFPISGPAGAKLGCQVCSGSSWAPSTLEAGLGGMLPAPQCRVERGYSHHRWLWCKEELRVGMPVIHLLLG